MVKQTRTIVHLPNLWPTVSLPNKLAGLLRLIIAASPEGINTLQLQEAGVIAPAAAVCHLKKHGARIHTYRQTARDAKGNMRNAVAHYVFRGWDGDVLAYFFKKETSA